MTISENTKLIPLTQDKHAIVDAEDYEWLSQWKWHFSNSGYAVRKPYDKTTGKSPKTILMHRLILMVTESAIIDHINSNTLDNRTENLRACNKSQNAMNSCRKPCGSSIYKGVCWDAKRNKWRARLKINYKEKHLGRFFSESDAARAYNKAAKTYFGEFARLNDI